MPHPPIESAVYSFEGLLPELDSPPIAARRALDHAGLRLSVEAWRSLPLEDRQRVTIVGVGDRIDAEQVASLLRRATPAPQRITPVSDPDPSAPPEALAKALEPARTIDAKRWSRLRAVDRYALAHTYRRAVARSAFSILGEAFDAVAAAAAPPPPPPPPQPPPPSPMPPMGYTPAGYYSTVGSNQEGRDTSPRSANYDGRHTPPSAHEPGYGGRTGMRGDEAGYAAGGGTRARADDSGLRALPRADDPGYAPSAGARPGSRPDDPGHAPGPRPGSRPDDAGHPPGAGLSVKTAVEPARAYEPPGRGFATYPPPAGTLSNHLNQAGEVHMVDVARKPKTERRAIARGSVQMRAETLSRLVSREAPKGEVLATARVAAVLAAKRAHEIIPLCHAVALTHLEVLIEIDAPASAVHVTAIADAYDRTGCEMEAMVSVSTACLTIYDMLKGIDRDIVISDVKLMEKSGGRSGHYRRSDFKP